MSIMSKEIETRSVCASTMAKCQNKRVRLIGRVIESGQPGPNAKVKVYAGPGNLITVTLSLESRIENLVEFIGTVTSPTSMHADSYHVITGELAEDFDHDIYCEALKYLAAYENPWNEGLA